MKHLAAIDKTKAMVLKDPKQGSSMTQRLPVVHLSNAPRPGPDR